MEYKYPLSLLSIVMIFMYLKMRCLIFNTLLIASSCFASPTYPSNQHSSHGAPTVKVKNGTYRGIYNPTYNQDYFLGIPYAQPPVNDLRFRVPQSLNSSWDTTKEATSYTPFCVGYGGDNIGFEMSEDCLYLSIIRPTPSHKSNTLLPVALWIHGGGLFMGGSADQRYNLSHIVSNSVSMSQPMLAISIQYRLSAFGFLGGKEALAGGATNLGFRDQRLALHWVQENIAAFGGDPEKVTIWGESAGAQSVGAQLLAYNGRDDKLFRAGIAQSGGPGNLFFPRDGGFNSTAPQTAYNTLISNTSCAHTTPTTSLDCLRSLPFSELNAALNISTTGLQPFPPTIDGDFLSTYPSIQLSRGSFVPVPLLIGTNTDEGTAFGSGFSPVNTDQQFTSLLNTTQKISPSSTASSIISALYPDIQEIGIPSLTTYPELVTPNSILARIAGSQARRVFAYFGDTVVNAPRRAANVAWSKHGVPSYAYRFDVTVNGIPEYIGATHFQEVAFVFNNTKGTGYAVDPFANTTSAFQKLAVQMSRSWVGFITGLDPNMNGLKGKGKVMWPVYNATTGGGAGEDIVFAVEGEGSYVESDTYRAEGIEWISRNTLGVYGR